MATRHHVLRLAISMNTTNEKRGKNELFFKKVFSTYQKVELLTGFEPVTSSLPRKCSTA